MLAAKQICTRTRVFLQIRIWLTLVYMEPGLNIFYFFFCVCECTLFHFLCIKQNLGLKCADYAAWVCTLCSQRCGNELCLSFTLHVQPVTEGRHKAESGLHPAPTQWLMYAFICTKTQVMSFLSCSHLFSRFVLPSLFPPWYMDILIKFRLSQQV